MHQRRMNIKAGVYNMKKTYCDCCLEEQSDDEVTVFNIVGRNERNINIEMCDECFAAVMEKATKQYKEIHDDRKKRLTNIFQFERTIEPCPL